MDEETIAENRILGLKFDKPTCSLTLATDGSSVTLEQSLELTWRGDVEKCKELINYFFPPGTTRPNIAFIQKYGKELGLVNGEYIFEAVGEGKNVRYLVKGDPKQITYLMASFISVNPLRYFERAVHDRGRMQ